MWGFLTHTGTAEDFGVGIALNTNGENLDTRREDVDILAKVGETGLGVVGGVNGTNSDRVGGRRWGDIGCVLLWSALAIIHACEPGFISRQRTFSFPAATTGTTPALKTA